MSFFNTTFVYKLIFIRTFIRVKLFKLKLLVTHKINRLEFYVVNNLIS